jgi:hypothetical protein
MKSNRWNVSTRLKNAVEGGNAPGKFAFVVDRTFWFILDFRGRTSEDFRLQTSDIRGRTSEEESPCNVKGFICNYITEPTTSNGAKFAHNELRNFPTKFGVKFTTSFPSSRFD